MNTHKGRLLVKAVAEKRRCNKKLPDITGILIGGVWFPWDGEEGKWVKFDMTLPKQKHGEDTIPNINDLGIVPGRMEYMAEIGYIELVALKEVKAEAK